MSKLRSIRCTSIFIANALIALCETAQKIQIQSKSMATDIISGHVDKKKQTTVILYSNNTGK